MNSLRNQITETQKVRSDLMKWKLVVVAALGGTGLGLNEVKFSNAYLILCFVPLAAVYIDALCAHLSLRIMAIGEFLISFKPLDRSEAAIHYYEKFLRMDPPKFKLETIALHWSTVFISLFTILFGYSYCINTSPIQFPLFGIYPSAILFYCSGSISLLLTVGILLFSRRRVRIIKKCAIQIITDPMFIDPMINQELPLIKKTDIPKPIPPST